VTTNAPVSCTAAGKKARYYAHDRSDFLEWVGSRFERVLDIGCGVGSNAPWYRRHGAREVIGVEIDEASAVQARLVLDRVVAAPIEQAVRELEGPFDLIVCADVLEHLTDPWSVVRSLSGLASGSTVLAVSIPNIRFLPALMRIAIGGGFRYTTEGIFDVTHVRFFTRPDVDRLLRGGGWVPLRWGSRSYGPFASVRRIVGLASRGRTDQWLAEQIFVVARPEGPGSIDRATG